jgi:RimJ/RimL family protein N-acetyltransferase
VPSTIPTPADRRVALVSPFPAHAWPRVWTWLKPFRRRVADDLDPQTLQAFVEQQLALQKLPNYRSWGVTRDTGNGPELGGLIALVQPRGVADPSAIAHLVFRREFFGFATAVPAIRAAFGEALAGGLQLIRGEIFEDNAAIRSLVLKVGARLYGVLGERRGQARVEAIPAAVVRGGKPAGVVGFVITAEDLALAAAPAAPSMAPYGAEAVREGAGPPEATPAAPPAPEPEEPRERPAPGLPSPE